MKTQQTEPKYHDCGCELSHQGQGLSYCPDCREDVLWPVREPTATPARTSHSPLPWTVQLETGGTHVNHMVCDSKYIVADMADRGEAGKANAVFIVRAVNNAQRLADALELAFDALDTPELRHARASQKHVNAYKAAREALAQWEKGISG